ncbi:hypothetical protein GDO81_023322 [Engystomops pustulosus]|uniref:Taste receptor type 2 n=1 Tax=Engystomops pustulosus TaxID=76066 RepID=A0AAV6Z9E0_ENGPU|nr:hypothetical protein GDO81_023322 [Engystomops pustulosus]
MITFPGYIFILVVNILDWRKNKRLDISDQLISGLSLFSLLYRILQIGNKCVEVIYGIRTLTGFTWLCINLAFFSLNFCTTLCSTWLSIHFCLKIVNIQHQLYIYIQRTFPKMFPWILLPSLLVSLLISGPAAQDLAKLYSNSTFLWNPRCSPVKIILSLKLYYFLFSFCFFLFFISLLVTIISLYRHIQRMQNHSVNLRNESVEAHVYAVKTLVLLFCLNLFQFIIPVLVMLKRHQPIFSPITNLFLVMWHVCNLPILIRGSSKLQKKFWEIFRQCTAIVS